MTREFFFCEEGFSTVGMAVALLLTVCLVFGAAQVYRVNSISADVQEVADAAALAAEANVAEFMVAVRTCDATALTMSLSSSAMLGAGLVALCVPGGISVGEKLIEMSAKMQRSRNAFAKKASTSLNRLQDALPFLCAASAASVAHANSDERKGSNYVAAAVLVPQKGERIGISLDEEGDRAQEIAQREADDVKSLAKQADEAAQESQRLKDEAYMHDCGNDPSYCLYERADRLADLSGAENPYYSNVDGWSFQVPLDRARAYYEARVNQERPLNNSVEEVSNSALRAIYYEYAVRQLETAYVYDDGTTFEASLPQLPKNTAEMRDTSMYYDARYPVSEDEEGNPMAHACYECPGLGEVVGVASVQDVEQGEYETCPYCEFDAYALGSVASASSSIANGFEYHWRAICRAAEDYQQAREVLEPSLNGVKEKVSKVQDAVKDALDAANGRIEAYPPGSEGVVAIVVNTGSISSDEGLESSFIDGSFTLGMRVAVSGATLLEDENEDIGDVVTSILEGVSPTECAALGAPAMAVDLWTCLMKAYSSGAEALKQGVRSVLNSLPLASASGLGTWAADAFFSMVEMVGLEPAKLSSLKPVLISTGYVTESDESSFSVKYRTVKQRALSIPASSGDAVVSLADSLGASISSRIDSAADKMVIADIELPFGGSIPLSIALPEAVKGAAGGLVDSAISVLKGAYASVTGRRVWQ